jgi:hypothetical protein
MNFIRAIQFATIGVSVKRPCHKRWLDLWTDKEGNPRLGDWDPNPVAVQFVPESLTQEDYEATDWFREALDNKDD